MTAPPLCHYCGKPIRKYTTIHWFGENVEFYKDHAERAIHHGEKPTSREEAQRYINHQVVSVEWSQIYKDGELLPREQQFIRKVTVWDGQSYFPSDGFFCNGNHSRAFAKLMAKAGHCTRAYNEALAKQREKAA